MVQHRKIKLYNPAIINLNTSFTHVALLWLCRWPSDCWSLTHSVHCGSVRTGKGWVDAHWRRPGPRCSPVVLLGVGVDVGGGVDVDGGVKLWTQLECHSGEGWQTGLMGKPGPWMGLVVLVCPGYPVWTKIHFLISLILLSCCIPLLHITLDCLSKNHIPQDEL